MLKSYFFAQHVESRYSGLTAEPGPDLEVEFEDEQISLSIPEDGINGWDIYPLIPPKVCICLQKGAMSLFHHSLLVSTVNTDQ